MIFVSGATGNIGTALIRLLREGGHEFRALVRDADGGRRLLGPEVELIEGDLTDGSSLRTALEGTDTRFLVSPNPELESQAVEAAQSAGVRRIVKSSALGSGTEPPPGHREVELGIERSGLGWTFLRPSAFMQTLVSYLPRLINHDGAFRLSAGEGRTGWVDTRDIATVAYRTLTEPGHEGQAYPVTGPEPLTTADVASSLSEAIGREIRYVDASAEEARDALGASGLPLGMGDFLVGHYQAVARGDFDLVTDVVEQVGRVKPRTLRACFLEHAGMFEPDR